MHQTLILEILKKHGQKLDRELVKETGIGLEQVRLVISELLATKIISVCSVINYENGQPIEGLLCRYSGYIPPAAPGRKANPQTK
jgi:transcription initiation factor IIE alpha subunit